MSQLSPRRDFAFFPGLRLHLGLLVASRGWKDCPWSPEEVVEGAWGENPFIFLNCNFSLLKCLGSHQTGGCNSSSQLWLQETMLSPVHCFVDQDHTIYLRQESKFFLFFEDRRRSFWGGDFSAIILSICSVPPKSDNMENWKVNWPHKHTDHC